MHTFRAYPKHQPRQKTGGGLMEQIIANAVRGSAQSLLFSDSCGVPHAILLFNGLMAMRHL
jgi:hypothetical protein